MPFLAFASKQNASVRVVSLARGQLARTSCFGNNEISASLSVPNWKPVREENFHNSPAAISVTAFWHRNKFQEPGAYFRQIN